MQKPPKDWPSTAQVSTFSSRRIHSRVGDDRVGAEVGEIVGLLLRCPAGQRADRGGAAGAALVQEQHPVVAQCPVEQGGRGRVAGGARRLEAGTAGEEDQERPVPTIRIGDLPGEHGDPLAVGSGVIEWDLELVLDKDKAIGVDCAGHTGHAAQHLQRWPPDKGDVVFSPVQRTAERACWRVHEDFERLRPGRAGQGRPLRRVVLHRGDHDRHLLPAELPGGAAQGTEHACSTRAPPPRSRPGYRACKRCRPDASPGSPQWNERADLVARAMRLIADGVVDREGVPGLARQLGYSVRQVERQLHRRARRRPARAGQGAAGADRAAADRDQRAADGRGRVRGRVRQHPHLQRHRARGVRAVPDRTAPARGAAASAASSRRDGTACPCGCRSARRCARTTCSATSPRPPSRVSRSGATARTGARCACRTGTASSRCGPRPTTSPASCRSPTCAT